MTTFALGNQAFGNYTIDTFTFGVIIDHYKPQHGNPPWCYTVVILTLKQTWKIPILSIPSIVLLQGIRRCTSRCTTETKGDPVLRSWLLHAQITTVENWPARPGGQNDCHRSVVATIAVVGADVKTWESRDCRHVEGVKATLKIVNWSMITGRWGCWYSWLLKVSLYQQVWVTSLW